MAQQRVSKRTRSAPTRLVAAEEEAPAAKKPRAPKAAPTSLKAKQTTKTPTKAKTKKATKKTTATKVKAKVATARVRAAKQVRRSHWTCG